LNGANAAFEDFISMAAHELLEPLRDVASLSQLIAETYAGRLDADADVFLDRIRKGAAQAQGLVAEVVEFWATCSGDRPSSPADMEAVLRQALLSAGKLLAERKAVVTHDPLPRVCGEFETLAKVLHRLIANAVEYSAAASPLVHISSERMDTDWVFSVQDNGPGIEPQFQQRVFGAFRRLHGKEYPGNGLGLAFCKRAVEWHGGRIWIDSMPGAGSTFKFSLPPAD
jgi:light-regulated signal transduction histidine kinase (bacteriophytochrome)